MKAESILLTVGISVFSSVAAYLIIRAIEGKVGR